MGDTEGFSGKRWIFYGSCIGGLIGVLVLLLNIYVTEGSQLAAIISTQPAVIIVFAMTAGLVGGAIGSFFLGLYVRDNISFNLGVSLGIGVLNGLIVGAITGSIIFYITKLF